MPSRVPDEKGHRRVKWLAFVIIHLSWSAHKVYQRYRRRFGIESSYRQFGHLRARTTSRNPAFRFLLLGLAYWSKVKAKSGLSSTKVQRENGFCACV